MRILVLQLARFGDIYLTWPVLRALKRTYPHAELHLVVRARFESATRGLDETVDHIHIFDTSAILAPLLDDGSELDPSLSLAKSVEELCQFVDSLSGLTFDRIVNLTFSPLSSHLTACFASPKSLISGYSRHPDGSFLPVDDLASYFLAQVGVDGDNEIHLLKIFAACAQVTLEKEDFRAPFMGNLAMPDGSCIAVQLYASATYKSLSETQWIDVLKTLVMTSDANFILIGSRDDQASAHRIVSEIATSRIFNFVGQTELPDLFSILRKSRFLIAPDSVTVHMATLTDTPVLNLSFSTVNALETGPWTSSSRVLYADEPEFLGSQKIVLAALEMLSGSNLTPMEHTPKYRQKLIQAIYFAEPFPMTDSSTLLLAYRKAHEVSELAISQCHTLLQNPSAREPKLILQEVDPLLKAIVGHAADLEPLLRWYQAELTRIPPGSFETILRQTLLLYQKLSTFCDFGSRMPLYDGREEFDDNSKLVDI